MTPFIFDDVTHNSVVDSQHSTMPAEVFMYLREKNFYFEITQPEASDCCQKQFLASRKYRNKGDRHVFKAVAEIFLSPLPACCF